MIKKITPFCIFRPNVSIYSIDYDKTKCMYFSINDENVVDKYTEIWEKVRNIIKKEFNRELIYN